MSLAAADSRQRRGASAPRRRAVAALAAVLGATAALAGTGSADTSTPVFGDPRGDSGAAVDLLSNVMTHVENSPGTAADDQLLLTSVLSKADQGARFGSDDRVFWYLNTDNNPATGGPGAVPGFSAIGAEYAVVLFGRDAPATVPDVELRAWNGTDFAFVRDLTASEVLIDQGRGIVGLQLPLAEVGAARGSTLALVQFSRTVSGSDSDFAPDAPPRYTLAIPAAPAPPVVTAAASAVAAGGSSLTVGATVDPRGLPTTFRFQYGTTAAYGFETSTGDAGSGTSPVSVTATVTGLAPATTYNFRVIATNAAGTTLGPNQVATTIAPAPTATTADATVTGARSALVSGVVRTHGVAGTAYFVWGRTAGRLSSRTRARAVDGDRVTVRAALRGLTPNRRYHYRVVVETPGGRAQGRVMAFVARRSRAVVDVRPRRGADVAGRATLRRLRTTVRAVSATSGRAVTARAALRSARLTVSCTRGCRLSEVVGLDRRSARVDHIAAPRHRFRGTGTRASGGRVTLAVRRSARRVALDLAPVFSDGRGHPYLFPKGSTILIRVNGPGLIPSATRITLGATTTTQRCTLAAGRAVACRTR